MRASTDGAGHLDLVSAAYLVGDLPEHRAAPLRGGRRLTSGRPALLDPDPAVTAAERDAARLLGAPSAYLARSTLHLATDLGLWLRTRGRAVLVDRWAYPVLGRAALDVAAAGAPVTTTDHHDARAVAAARAGAPSRRPAALLLDGWCLACGRPPPLARLLDALGPFDVVVVDASQVVGLWDPGRRHADARVLLVASFTKTFGAPLAALAGPARLVDDIRQGAFSQVHCTPSTRADVAAFRGAARDEALHGARRRRRLRQVVGEFRASASDPAVVLGPGLHPVQLVRGRHVPAPDLAACLRAQDVDVVTVRTHRGAAVLATLSWRLPLTDARRAGRAFVTAARDRGVTRATSA